MSFWKPRDMNDTHVSHEKTEVVTEKKPKVQKKTILSKKTLSMKFMQRKQTKAQVEKTSREKEAEQWNELIQEHNDSSTTSLQCSRDFPDPSLVTRMGRRSFGGFNKFIERESPFQSGKDIQMKDQEDDDPDAISDDQMAKQYARDNNVKLQQNKQRFFNKGSGKRNQKNGNSAKSAKRQRQN